MTTQLLRRALSVALLAALPVCSAPASRGAIGPSLSGVSGTVHFTSANGSIVASNALLELRWDASTGALVGLASVATGTEFLSGDVHSAWSAAVDQGTDDVWAARPLPAPPGPSTTLTAFAARALDGGGFTFDLTFAPSGPVSVTQHVTLRDDDPVSHWTTDVVVDRRATAVSVASPELLGVAQQPGEQLAWPWHEGVIFPQPGATLHTMQYPAPASMQWMELYTSREGLYYGVIDTSGSYKELRFGYDPALGHADAQPRQMAAAFHPYATASRAYTTPEVEVGVAPAGGWYWGADRYRAFLSRSNMRRTLPKIARELTGWHRGFGKTRTQTYGYCAIPTLLMPADFTQRTGLSVLLMYGWHYGGLDAFYPDYDFLSKDAADPTCLAAADLASAMQTLSARPKPNRVMFYINSHIADPASEWFKDPAHASAQLLDANGGRGIEYYDDVIQKHREFRAMCPSASAWSDRLREKARELRTLAPPGAGAVGVYWDQLEEVPTALCYDRTHGHATPASAIPDGYRALLEHAHEDFALGGSDTEYIFSAEGVSDFYSQLVDLAGGMPVRTFGYAPADCGEFLLPCGGAKHAPEIARYAMFARFVGHPNYRAKLGDKDEYARAFLMADAFKSMEVGAQGTSTTDPYASTNAFAFPRYANIYASEPEIYFYGRYVDAKGLSISGGSDVMATLIVGANEDRIGVQLWNAGASDVATDVAIDLGVLGLASRAATALVDLDGIAATPLTTSGTLVRFRATVAAHDVKAFKVALQ